MMRPGDDNGFRLELTSEELGILTDDSSTEL
jgi:hypothetical protein